MEIKKKTDHTLLSELKGLVSQEKNIHVKVIAYLREVDRRELHVARGFSSLFAFCTEYLGYTEAETHVRIQAMRLSREIPAISQKIKSGELSLTAVAQAQTVFRRQKIDRKAKEAILKSLENKSTRAVNRTLAILFPTEPKPEKTKAVSEEFTRVEFNANRRLMEKLEKLKELLAHKNFSGRYDLLFEHLADEALKKLEKLEKKLDSPRAESSNPSAKENSLEKIGTGLGDSSIQEHEHDPRCESLPESLPGCDRGRGCEPFSNSKFQPGLVPAPKKSSPAEPSPPSPTICSSKSSHPLGAPQATKTGRYIPIAVKRIIWKRRQMGCAYVDPLSGRLCGSKHGLEIDHIKEFAAGGSHEPENLQLFCRSHNQFKSREYTRRFRLRL